MAASVAVTKVPATQPGDQKPAMHDGKTGVNSPLTSTADPIEIGDNAEAGVTSKKLRTGSGAQQDGLNTHGSPMHSDGKSASLQEDVGRNDSAIQKSLPNGDYTHHQTGSARSSNNNTSCYCPDGPRTRPAPANKRPRPIPRKIQPRAPPPKLPPKPPHLLQHRSPSSEDLLGRSKTDCDRDTQGRDRRSQSVSVVSEHHLPQREDFPAAKLSKRPVPTPRKSLPNILGELSPSREMKNLIQPSTDRDAEKHSDSDVVSPVSDGSDSKSPSHRHEPLSPSSQSSHDSPVHRHQEKSNVVTKQPRRISSTTRHVRVRERAAIFEKLIEVETTRSRDSQISEPRSRPSSRASDFNEPAFSIIADTPANTRRSRDRHHSYVNIQGQDGIVLPQSIPPRKDVCVEDDTVSVVSVSSDSVFSSPQTSIRSHHHHPPSPNLSEDEDNEDAKISNRESGYTDVVVPDTYSLLQTEESRVSLSDSDYTDVVVPATHTRDTDYTDVVVPDSVTSQDAPKLNMPYSQSNPNAIILKSRRQKTDSTEIVGPDSEPLLNITESKTSHRESDQSVIPADSSTSQDSLSPKVALNAAGPSPRPLQLKFSLPVEQSDISKSSAPVRHDLLSPDTSPSLPKPFHGAHTYRNVTPLFCVLPRQTKDKDDHSSDTESAGKICKQADDVTHGETGSDQEGTEMTLVDNTRGIAAVKISQTTPSKVHSPDQLLTDGAPIAEDTEGTAENCDMPPEPRRRDQRSKSHPAAGTDSLYEVRLPDFIDPLSLKKRDGAVEAAQVSPTANDIREPFEGAEVHQGTDDDESQHTYQDIAPLPDTEQNLEGDGSDMLCNRSRRQRVAVKKRDSNVFGAGRKKWQHDSAPASLGALERQEAVVEQRGAVMERQEAVTEPSEEVSSPLENCNRLSQVSSVGSTISSLISNVSIEDEDQLSSDEEDYEDVQAPSSDASQTDAIPPLPPITAQDADCGDRENDARQLPSEDSTYSTLYELQSSSPEMQHEVHPEGLGEDEEEETDQEEEGDNQEEDNQEEEQDDAPVEMIEMQPMRKKSPHSPEKESRRKAFEFHIPLFLRNSSSIESSASARYGEDGSRHSQTTHSEDSDASSDYIDDITSVPGSLHTRHRNVNARDSNTSFEQSEDSLSIGSGPRLSMESLNLSVQSELQDNLRRRGKKVADLGRPVSQYDRPVSSILTEYNRPVSSVSSDYDRPVSSTSSDYIKVLDSFHKDGKKDEDSEGFSFTWTLDHGEEGSHQDESYRPKSDEVAQTTPAKYALPRKASDPVPVLPVASKALKPPKVPRPYSEPSLSKKRNSLVQCKHLPVPSKEEITEQFSKISRQRSRFVSQEPLFQLYQADARSRDSYLRLMNVSSLESLATFLEKQEALKKEKRGSEPLPIPPQLPEYRVLIPDEELYPYQSGEECKSADIKNKYRSEDNKRASRLGDGSGEAIYQSAEPVYEPPGELFYETGDILQSNTIYESGSLGSSTGEGSGGSSSDVEMPKPYGLMQRTTGASAIRRSFWSELPEVVGSGLLEQMTSEEKRLQEALFEVITSEASYLRSLNLVVEHFSEAITLQPPTGLLNKVQHHRLFSNIKSVRDASERLLLDLEERQQDSIIISDVCDILLQHFEKGGFNCYIVYCANNQYQVKTLEELRKNPSFIEVMKLLESSPACCSLDLQSFLMLPFQRITRLPLLIEAIRQQAKPDSPLHSTALQAVKALRNMAEKCNEEAKRMEMIEEVTQLANQLDFREGVKKMNLSQTTSIVKRGRLHIIKKDNKLLNRGKLIAKAIYVIVFTDKVAVCKQRMKGEQLKYDVFDWCPRNLVQVEAVANPQNHSKLPDGVPNTCKHVFIISFLQNNQKKEVEFAVDANSEAERERWMDAMHPAKRTKDGETIYESWDCPQVMCKQPYEAKDRDELTLDLYDRVDIDKKIEGWYYGTRVSDHAKGWFPASFTQEIVNDHVLARNLKQRHRLLSLCDQHLRTARNAKK